MIRLSYFIGIVCSLFFWASCSNSLPKEVAIEFDSLPEEINFNFHVKPILSDRCYICHGPDANKRKGNLRLDVGDINETLISSVVPKLRTGRSVHSKIVERIISSNEEVMMPPPESKLSLNAKEKAILIKWIRQGAKYEEHWAFTKPQKKELPKAGKDWVINEIDYFIAQKHKEQNIEPSPEAQRDQLIRRLFFDLTGLPPSLEDLDRWTSDKREDYYQHLVDYLLASKEYGERMAVHWLDVSRFADSEGYLDDFHHSFWPYRDWVIKAYNENVPYDDFIHWQVGGDQIKNATTGQILATAFNRHHKQNSEGGATSEEFRIDYVADRTNTFGAAFMGLTVGCARCHDHKYDPLSQENYYELFSFFNSTIEQGHGIFGHNAIQKTSEMSNFLSMNAGPVLALPSNEVAEIRKFMLEEIDKKSLEIKELELSNELAFNKWLTNQKDATALTRAVDNATINHLTFDLMEDGKDRDEIKDNKSPTYYGKISSGSGKKGLAVISDAQGQYIADGKKSSFERSEPFTISFWIKAPKSYDKAQVMYNGNNRIQGYRGWDVIMDGLKLDFRLNHAFPYQSLTIRTLDPIPSGEWVHFVWTYDGSSKANGMKLYQDGENVEVEIIRDYLYRSTRAYTDLRGSVYMPYKGIVIGNRHYDQDFTGGMLDEVRILNKQSDDLVALYLFDKAIANQSFETNLSTDQEKLARFFDLFYDEDLEDERQVLRDIRTQEVQTIDTIQEIMVMGDYDETPPTHILERGEYTNKGKLVERDVPEFILKWQDHLPRNRDGLGQWLVHPDHPLTSRVAVNQYWSLIFGRGLVETVEDLGFQSSIPSHPELLDWLAVDFQENDWDLKRLIKQMVMSATYRQSSKVRTELNEIDPDNQLLASSPRYRRSAEMIRDNILAASGLLETQIGGPSVFPYQPPNLWKEAMTHGFFPEYEIDYENGLYRRSIYTFWKRLMPPPNMLVFDASTRTDCQVRRQQSNTPLQALVLLNDPQFLEGCRVLAENMWSAADGKIETATFNTFRLLTSRNPSKDEHQLLLEQYEDELNFFDHAEDKAFTYLSIGKNPLNDDLPLTNIAALTRVTNTILNTTEGFYKN